MKTKSNMQASVRRRRELEARRNRKKLRVYAALVTGGFTVALSMAYLVRSQIIQPIWAFGVMGVFLAVFGFVWHINRPLSPDKLVQLLEQDAAAQAERLQHLGETLETVTKQQKLVPVFESEEPTTAQPAVTADGRNDYQYMHPSKRVRRRII